MAAVVLLALSLVLYAFVQGRHYYDQLAANNSRNIASAFERHVDDLVKRANLTLLSVAEIYQDEARTERQERQAGGPRSAAEGTVRTARLQQHIERLLSIQPELASIRIVDAAGMAYVGNDLPPSGRFDMSATENFVLLRDGLADQLVVSNPYLGSLTKRWGIALSRPLAAADGSFDGMVVAVLSTDTFKEVFSAPDLGTRGFAHLHGADEAIVFSYPASAGVDPLVGQDRASPEVYGAIQGQQRDVTLFTQHFDGVRRATTVRQVADYPLFLDVAIDPRDFMAGWRVSILALTLTALIFVVVVALSSLRLYRSSQTLAASEAHWRDAADRLQLTINAGQFGTWERDMATGALTASAAAMEMWGFPAVTPISFDQLLSVVVDEDRDRVARGVAAALENRTDWNQDYRVLRPDGSVIWINSIGRPYYSDAGHPERVRGVVQDITARKAAEQSLQESYQALRERSREVRLLNAQLERRAIEAETAMSARDAFLRNVSHELRTPLNHIIGATDLLSMQPHDASQEPWLQMLKHSSGDLLVRVNQILDAARLEAGEVSLAHVEFSPAKVLDEARLLYVQRAKDKGIELLMAPDPDLPDTVVGDPQRVAQGLLNYLDNALKFTERGAVILGARPLPAEPQDALIRFEVRDTGMGIDDSVKPRLFETFVQGDAAVAHAHGGLGVGLSTTLKLARVMGGDAGVESAPGQGSLFWFTARFDRPAGSAADTGATGMHAQVAMPPA